MRATKCVFAAVVGVAISTSLAWAQSGGAGSGGAAGTAGGVGAGGTSTPGGLGSPQGSTINGGNQAERANAAGNGNPANVNAPLGGAGTPRSSPPTAEAAGTSALQTDDLNRTIPRAANRGAADVNPATLANPRSQVDDLRAAGSTNRMRTGAPLSKDWRYVYFQGRHWYWNPNNTWSIWNGTTWSPVMVATGYRGNPQARVYRGYGEGRYNHPAPGSMRPGSMQTMPDRLPPTINRTGPSAAPKVVPGANAPDSSSPTPNQAELDRAAAARRADAFQPDPAAREAETDLVPIDIP